MITHTRLIIAPALILCFLAVGAGHSQQTPVYFRWDLMMIEEAHIWQYLLVEYSSGDRHGSWGKRKEALQTILGEFPESRWAADAALCLAAGRAGLENDPEGAIAEWMQVVNQYPDRPTIVSHITSGHGVLDPVWRANRYIAATPLLDGSTQSFPFDMYGVIPREKREILAYFDLLERQPILARDIAQLTLATVYHERGDVIHAITTLESMISTSIPIARLAKVDREAAAGEDGWLIRRGDPAYFAGKIWRPQYMAYLSLSYLYLEEGSLEKGVALALEWLSAVSPDGWYWEQNRRLAEDILAQYGYWKEAVAQYQIALEGIQQNIADETARMEMLYEEGGWFGELPPDFIGFEDSIKKKFQGTITQIEEALARAESHLPTTSVTWEESAVTRGEQAFLLGPNAPNPFNASTVIRFSLPHPMEIRITIVNLMGQEIRTLVEGPQEGGGQQVIWDGTDQQGRPVASGLYLCRLTTEELTATRKMTLLR